MIPCRRKPRSMFQSTTRIEWGGEITQRKGAKLPVMISCMGKIILLRLQAVEKQCSANPYLKPEPSMAYTNQNPTYAEVAGLATFDVWATAKVR